MPAAWRWSGTHGHSNPSWRIDEPPVSAQEDRERAIQNVAFKDMLALMEGLGFRLSRVRGSHHIFSHPELREQVNL